MSIDPLTSKYSDLTPYQYAGNMPASAIEREGEDFIVVTWRSRSGNQGHSALAIANWKTVEIDGANVNIHDGTFTLFEVFPAGDGEGTLESFINNPGQVIKGIVAKTENLTLGDILGRQTGSKKPSGAIRVRSNPNQDKQAIDVLNSQVAGLRSEYQEIGETGHYERVETYDNTVNYSLIEAEGQDNCTFNCSSFIVDQVELLYQLELGPAEHIKTKGGRVFGGSKAARIDVPPIDVNAYTPNQVFKIFEKIGEVLKGAEDKANKADFINQVTREQLKDETPNN